MSWNVLADAYVRAAYYPRVEPELLAGGLVDSCADHPPTANPNGRAKRIDRVLHAPALRARVEPGLAIDGATPLPSPALPSDHVPVIVWLET